MPPVQQAVGPAQRCGRGVKEEMWEARGLSGLQVASRMGGKIVSDSAGQQQGERPRGVAVVGWFLLIATTVATVFWFEFLAQIVDGPGVQMRYPVMTLGVPIVGNVGQVLIAVGILRGRRRARSMFFWFIKLTVVLGLLLGGRSFGLVIKSLWYAVFAYLLTRPSAVAFFEANTPAAVSRWRRGPAATLGSASTMAAWSPEDPDARWTCPQCAEANPNTVFTCSKCGLALR